MDLSGQVTDPKGNGLNGVTVKALPYGSTTPTATTTTATVGGVVGCWSFSGLADNTYVVQIETPSGIIRLNGKADAQFNSLTVGTILGSNAEVVIQDILLAADAVKAEFTSIPQTYKHLKVLASSANTNAGNAGRLALHFNGDTGTNYRGQVLYGYTDTGTTQQSGTYAWGTGSTIIEVGRNANGTSVANSFAAVDILIPDYTSGHLKQVKSFCSQPLKVSGANFVGGGVYLCAGLWNSTSPITSISLFDDTATLRTGSRYTLIGVP